MKNSLKLRVLAVAAAILALTASSACSDSTPSDSAPLFNIVRLESQGQSSAVFSYQLPDAPNPVFLTSDKAVVDPDLVAVGDRLMLVYTPLSGQPYESGEIIARGYSLITNAEMTESTLDEIGQWNANPVYLLSAWRAGNYLNVNARLPFDTRPRAFGLAKDIDSDNPRRPDLYLIHRLDDPVPTFDRQYYASFDISKLVQDPDIEGFTLHLRDSNLNLSTIEFDLR